MIYLLMFIRYHNSQGKLFSFIEPENGRVKSYLTSQKFWERCNAVGTDPFVRPIGNLTSFNDLIDIDRNLYIADEVGETVRNILANESVLIDRYLVALLTEELVDNFRRHSEHGVGACAFQYYPQLGSLRFAVGDCGIGIRESLSRNPRYSSIRNQTDEAAAKLALDEGVSGHVEGGTGFSTIIDGVRELRGRFYLSTGNAWLRHYHSYSRDKVIAKTTAYGFPGVRAEFQIPV